MICRWSSGHCLKDGVLAGSSFILSGISVPPPQIFRGTPARISDSGIRLMPTPATMNSSAGIDDRGFLPVFPRRMRKDVLCQIGRFVQLPISPANYRSKHSGNDMPVRRRVRANSSPDKQGNGDPSKSHGLIPMVIDLITGILGLLIKLIPKVLLPFWSKEKDAFLKITEDAKDAADVVGEVTEDVKEIAELIGKVAEGVEGNTREEGSVHKIAELVDNFSNQVVKDAAFVENIADEVEEATKTVDEIVEDVGDVKIPEDGSKGVTTSSSGPSDKSLKGSSVQTSKFVNSADIPSEISEGIVRWLARFLVGGALTCVDVPQKRLILLGSGIGVLCFVLVSIAAWGGCLPLGLGLVMAL